MVPHTLKAIELGTTNNLKGTQKFFLINTDCILNRSNFTEYPITDRVIKKVNKCGKKMSRYIYRSRLEFRNRTIFFKNGTTRMTWMGYWKMNLSTMIQLTTLKSY